MTNPTLQQQYSIRAQIPEFEKVISGWVEESAAARREAPCLLNQSYGDSAAETLDVFPAAAGGAKACIVFLRGGFWRSLDKSAFSVIAPAYTSLGATVVVINYAHCPAVTLQQLVGQVYRACAWLYDNSDKLGLPRDRFHILAHSAGAHLGAMALAQNWSSHRSGLPKKLFQSAVLVSGLYDLRPLVDLSFINNDIRLTPELAASLSPALIDAATDAKAMIVSGELESDAFKLQSQQLVDHWHRNVEVALTLPATNHLATFEALRTPGSALHAATTKMINL